ncbi:hypothetical protein GpartN1_g1730.t1 [Galdieria partita]|uniref:Uncharacterized protein n=1 Tax=Galdieria partita TaxID=83374 RepID=A0A9C7UNI2_9RHOD|nr:hypothetical protein GpartN1_g1730.t1 [Galdieria partita]
MGVKGLWELVAPVGRRVSMDTVANKTLAIDVSIWLTQFLYAMRDSEGELIRNAHLLGILRRCCKLIFYNVKPIFVFDGATPQLKRRTLISRQNQRNKQKLRLRRIAEKLLLNELKLKKLKENKKIESKGNEERVNPKVNPRDLYNQYMDTVLRATLERSNIETEKDTDQVDIEAVHNHNNNNSMEQLESLVEEREVEAQLSEAEEEGDEKEEDINTGVSNFSERLASSEREQYEVPDISQISTDSLSSLPPEMFETIVSEIRSRERNLHREEFIKAENDPANFSKKQLEGFLRLSQTKKEVVKARATAYSHVLHGRRRIASDPGKNYTLTKISDSTPENGRELNDDGQFCTNFRLESSIESNNSKVDEGLDCAKSTSNAENHSEFCVRHSETKNEREPVLILDRDIEGSSQADVEEDEDIEWVACPPDSNCNFVEHEWTSNVQVEWDGMEQNIRNRSSLCLDSPSSADLVKHLNEDDAEEEDFMTADIQSAIYSSLANEHCLKHEAESCAKPCESHLESTSKVDFWDKEETMNSLNSLKEDENEVFSRNVMSSKVDEALHSSPSSGNHLNTCFEEEILNEEEITETRVSRDFILPDEKLESLFQEFENERKELHQEFTHLKSGSDMITDEMCEEIRDLLRMLGIPYIQAPMEAEAQCAYFNQIGLVEGVITEDSDAFLFGARTVFRNIFEDKKYVEQYEMDDIERYLGLDREKLILLCLLLGSDYTQGIHGVGVVNATEIIRAFPSFEELKEFAQWANQLSLEEERLSLDPEDPNFVKKEFFLKHRKMKRNWVVHDSFPSKHVMDAYSYPVIDTRSIEFQCQRPNMAQLVEFCRAKFGWDSDKVKKLVVPVLKAYDAKNQSQTRIEQYFHPMRFAKIKSKRLENAVRGITMAVDEEMFLSKSKQLVEDVNSSTDEKTSNMRKRRKKNTKDRRKKYSYMENGP